MNLFLVKTDVPPNAIWSILRGSRRSRNRQVDQIGFFDLFQGITPGYLEAVLAVVGLVMFMSARGSAPTDARVSVCSQFAVTA